MDNTEHFTDSTLLEQTTALLETSRATRLEIQKFRLELKQLREEMQLFLLTSRAFRETLKLDQNK